jgi:hypothetical protein
LISDSASSSTTFSTSFATNTFTGNTLAAQTVVLSPDQMQAIAPGDLLALLHAAFTHPDTSSPGAAAFPAEAGLAAPWKVGDTFDHGWNGWHGWTSLQEYGIPSDWMLL